MEFVLMLLGNRWVQLAIGCAVALFTGYLYGHHSGYTSEHVKVVACQENHRAYVTSQETAVAIIKSDSEAKANDINRKLEIESQNREALHGQLQKEIRSNQKLRSQLLDADAVRLFNQSTGTSEQQAKPDSSTGKVSGASEGTSTDQKTLADLLAVSAENNENHQACIDQVHGLQKLYQEIYDKFEEAVKTQ